MYLTTEPTGSVECPRLVLKVTVDHKHSSTHGEGPAQTSIGRHHIGLRGGVSREASL